MRMNGFGGGDRRLLAHQHEDHAGADENDDEERANVVPQTDSHHGQPPGLTREGRGRSGGSVGGRGQSLVLLTTRLSLRAQQVHQQALFAPIA